MCYSKVVESTIDTIVPALVNEQKAAAESRGAARRVDRVVPVVAIFVDALDHIPKHRSLKLFVKLLATLGSSECVIQPACPCRGGFLILSSFAPGTSTSLSGYC